MSRLHPAYFAVRFRTGTHVAEWPTSFAIITAYATTGETWTEARNREADGRLHAELFTRGLRPIRITGFDPDTQHAEPGWAVELPQAEALEMGRRYLQDAIFHVVGDELSVCSCAPEGRCAAVGSFTDRLTT
jgi:hypothetical protein